jgi:hypothetical protein
MVRTFSIVRMLHGDNSRHFKDHPRPQHWGTATHTHTYSDEPINARDADQTNSRSEEKRRSTSEK